jgi:hypothetical protein
MHLLSAAPVAVAVICLNPPNHRSHSRESLVRKPRYRPRYIFRVHTTVPVHGAPQPRGFIHVSPNKLHFHDPAVVADLNGYGCMVSHLRRVRVNANNHDFRTLRISRWSQRRRPCGCRRDDRGGSSRWRGSGSCSEGEGWESRARGPQPLRGSSGGQSRCGGCARSSSPPAFGGSRPTRCANAGQQTHYSAYQYNSDRRWSAVHIGCPPFCFAD